MLGKRTHKAHGFFLFGSFALLSLVVACGGGISGGPSGGISSGGGPPATLPTGTVQFTVTEPYTPGPPIASSGRTPQFAVPPSTQSVSLILTQVNGSPPPSPSVFNANLGSSVPGCTTSSTTLTCQFSAQEPAGSDSFSVLTYQQQNQAGGTLGGGSMDVDVTAGQTVQAPATLTGTIASISVAVAGSVPEGVATSLPLDVVAKDSSGNTIIGTYSNPIALVDSDTSGATSLSVKSLTTAGAVTLAYNGSPMSAPVSITASASGVPATAVTPASFLPLSSVPAIGGATSTETTNSSMVTVAIGSPGPTATPSVYTSTFTNTYTTGATYNGISGLVKVETTYPQPSASPSIWDAYYQWAPGASAGSWAYGYVGGTYDVSGDQFSSTTCNAPYGSQWIVPFPQTWNYYAGDGSCSYAYKAIAPDPFVYSASESQNADGSYSYTITYAPGTLFPTGETDTDLVHSDGTALITDNNAAGSYIVAVGTPAPGASSIPLEVQSFPAALPSPGASATPAPVATSEPNWYSQAGLPNGSVPSPLQTLVYTTKGTTTLPAQCQVSASILGSSPTVTEIDSVSTSFDPTFYYTTTADRSFLVDGLGDVCDLTTTTTFDNFDAQSAGLTGYGGIGVAGVYQNTTESTNTSASYITTTSLTAAMKATRSFAAALPTASQMLLLGSIPQRDEALIRAQIRERQLVLQRRLFLQRR